MLRSYVAISLLVACCFCLGSTATALAASKQVNMTPGLWEITTEINMEGMPYAIPPTTHTMCMSKDDLVPGQTTGQKPDDCSVDFEIVDKNTVVWESTCRSEEGQIISKGKTIYRGSTFEGEMTTQIPNAGTTKQIITGKRVGPCP